MTFIKKYAIQKALTTNINNLLTGLKMRNIRQTILAKQQLWRQLSLITNLIFLSLLWLTVFYLKHQTVFWIADIVQGNKNLITIWENFFLAIYGLPALVITVFRFNAIRKIIKPSNTETQI